MTGRVRKSIIKIIMKKVFGIFFKNFFSWPASIGFIISAIAPFIFWYFKPDQKIEIPAAVLIPIFTFLFFLFLALVKTIYDLYNNCFDFSNPIIDFEKDLPKFASNSKGIIIAKYYPWVINGMVVSIYHKKKDLEILIGFGEVIDIQSNNLIQILVLDIDPEYLQNLENKIGLNEILIKPFAIRRLFGV